MNEDDVTPLTERLGKIASQFSKWGLLSAGAILIAFIVNRVIEWSVKTPPFVALMEDVVTIFTIFISVILVAVPEGLPLSVSISLAYSFVKMKDEEILVKHPDSLEKMGGVEEICTGKTATLTENKMSVHAIYTQSRLIQNTKKNTFVNSDLYDDVISLVTESVLYNCDARIEMDDEAFWSPVGNGTECGLIKFL